MATRTTEIKEEDIVSNEEIKKRISDASLRLTLFSIKMKELTTAKKNTMVVSEIYDVYSCTAQSAIDISTEYRLLFCHPPNNQDIMWCIKTDDLSDSSVVKKISFRQLDYKAFSRLQEFELYEEKLKAVKQGYTGEEIDGWNTDEILKLFDKEEDLWKLIVDWTVDDTFEKDERITNIIKSSYIVIPLRDLYLQRYNNHGVVITNAKTGKSETFLNLSGNYPSSDWTVAGLLGSSKDYIRTGSLQGTGMYGFDETTANLDHDAGRTAPIFDKLLNYMEGGDAKRDLIDQVRCVGTKCLLFFGNNPHTISEKSALKMMSCITGSYEMEKVGRRLAHLVFSNDIKVVKNKMMKRNEVELKESIRSLINEICKKNQDKISNSINTLSDFCTGEDIEYISELDSFIESMTTESMKSLIKGMKNSVKRLQFASVKIVILNNLDKILNKKMRPEDMLEKLLPELNEYYGKFKRYNIESFIKIREDNTGYEKFIEDCSKLGVNIEEKLKKEMTEKEKEELYTQLGISRATFYRYLIKYEKKVFPPHHFQHNQK